MSRWREFEITGFKGMATNIAQPDKSQAVLCKNLDIHEKPGTLTLRPGYELKYLLPSDSRITSEGFVSFGNFYDKTADIDGQEVTVLIEKGVVESEDGSIPDTQDQPNIWVRPSRDGSSWVDEWEWLNEIVITKVITATDATYKSMIEVASSPPDDYYIGWTMWNKTQNIVSQVITSKIDPVTGNVINHTLYNSEYAVDDIIYLFKNYIDPTYLAEMYNATAQEIVYHTVLGDMRIGFGGKENRVGLSIGFRNKYFKIKEVDFTNVHADLTPAALIAFAHVYNVVIDEYSFVSKPYGIDLTEVTGTLGAETYYFRLTGLLDDNSEVLLSEKQITIGASKDIEIRPYSFAGQQNKRITDYKIYYSTDGNTYHKLKEYSVSESTNTPIEFVINEDGKIVLDTLSTELYSVDDAASIVDADSTGDWFNPEPKNAILITSDADAVDNYAIKGEGVGISPGKDLATIINTFGGVPYNIAFQTKTDIGSVNTEVFLAKSYDPLTPLSNTLSLASGTSYAPVGGTLTPTENADIIVFIMDATVTDIFIDQLSIENSNDSSLLTSSTEAGAEISAEMGYTPSFNLVKDWEQCLVFNGRGHYLNPYIEKEWDNFIMLSAISSGYMYDAVTAGTFLELDEFDGSKTVGMALMPNGSLLILKDESVMTISPINNRRVSFGRGKGCISKDTIVSLSGTVAWCSQNDIYMIVPSRGSQIVGLLDESIRDLYLATSSLELASAIQDKYNTYRLKTYDSANKKEYLLTDRGWIEQSKALYVNMYRAGHDNSLWFMNDGSIYVVDEETVAPIIASIILSSEIPI